MNERTHTHTHTHTRTHARNGCDARKRHLANTLMRVVKSYAVLHSYLGHAGPILGGRFLLRRDYTSSISSLQYDLKYECCFFPLSCGSLSHKSLNSENTLLG